MRMPITKVVTSIITILLGLVIVNEGAARNVSPVVIQQEGRVVIPYLDRKSVRQARLIHNKKSVKGIKVTLQRVKDKRCQPVRTCVLIMFDIATKLSAGRYEVQLLDNNRHVVATIPVIVKDNASKPIAEHKASPVVSVTSPSIIFTGIRYPFSVTSPPISFSGVRYPFQIKTQTIVFTGQRY